MCLHFNIYGAMIKWQNYDIDCGWLQVFFLILKYPSLPLKLARWTRSLRSENVRGCGFGLSWDAGGGSPISRRNANERSPVIC